MISRWLYNLEFLCFEVFWATEAGWYVSDDTDWIGNRIEPPNAIVTTNASWTKELTGNILLGFWLTGSAPVLPPSTVNSNIRTFAVEFFVHDASFIPHEITSSLLPTLLLHGVETLQSRNLAQTWICFTFLHYSGNCKLTTLNTTL